MATITSGIPGDINQVKRRQSATDPAGIQQLTRQSLQPQAGITSVAPPTQPRPSPLLPGDPARAARMQAQMNQPVTKVEQGPGTGDRLLQGVKDAYGVAKPLLMPAATAAGILAAPVIDAGRNTAIRAAGGDPNTAEGGSTKYQDRAFGEIQPALKAAEAVGDATRRGAGNAVLSITGAKPVAAVQSPGSSAPSASIAALPDKPALPATSKPGSATASMPPAAGNGYQNTGIAGVVGRRGANGQMEFTNEAGAVSGAQGNLAGHGDGKGTLSIISGGAEGMRRNLRAAEILQQTRRANNPGMTVTVVEDSTRGTKAEREARAAAAQAQSLASAGKGGALAQPPVDYAATNRNLAAGEAADLQANAAKRNDQAQQRVQDVLTRLTDQDTPPAEREQLQRTYATLTTPAKDRYVLQDTVLGYDEMSQKPILGRVALDTTTGQPVAGQQGQIARPGSQPQRSVGTTYVDANGNRAKFLGYDAQGNEQWGNA